LATILKGEMAPIIDAVLSEIMKTCMSKAGIKEEVE